MPKNQSGYQLEFAVDAQTETTAIQHLADTFGAAIKKQILPAQISRHLRNKAAHPQLISAQDLADAKAQAAFIMKYIANIRADYDIALKECAQCLTKEISVADIQPALAELVR